LLSSFLSRWSMFFSVAFRFKTIMSIYSSVYLFVQRKALGVIALLIGFLLIP
jgi:hypothetical protein